MSVDQVQNSAGPATAGKLPLAALVCPDCRVPLETTQGLRCGSCGAEFPIEAGVPVLWPPSRREAIRQSIESFRGHHAGVRESRLFRALLPPSSVADPGRKAREARVREFMAGGELVVNLGSKAARWGPRVVNLDLVMPHGAEPGAVDLLGDISRLPFADASVDGVICTDVLEHVPDARACVDEIARVVKPGGHVYVKMPFIFPTHPDPLDRWRWTLDGLVHAMGAFEKLDAGTSGGPFSAITSIVPTAIGSMFSNFFLFNVTRTALGWAMWPVKFLDYLSFHSKREYMAPANIYFIGRKRA
jgi:SAM-dependent methyltransferase